MIELIYGAIAENPQRVGRTLNAPLQGLQSARRGDFRVIHRIDSAAARVTVIAIGHRSDIYRRR